MPEFQYKPLETPETIRLALIPQRSANSQENVELELRHYGLPLKSLNYNALSYVWGDPTKKHLISLNGKDFWVTDSLMFFLLRPQPFASEFWIAICLDQNNNEEKYSQIPRMKEIYEQATHVFADLGPASEDEELAADHTVLFARVWSEEIRRVEAENSGILIIDKIICPFMDPYDEAVWKRIGEFLKRPWWRRAWIMQESTAILNTRLWYGSKSCRFVDAMGMELALSLLHIRKPWRDGTPLKLPSINISRVKISEIYDRGKVK